MSKQSIGNDIFLTIVCPYRKWIDLFIASQQLDRQVQSMMINKESDIHEITAMKHNGSLLDQPPIYHFITPSFSLLKKAISHSSAPCIFSINQLNSKQKKSLSELGVSVKDMQYPKSSDINTAIHLFKKIHNSQANFNSLISGNASHLDELLEACERQHLLSLHQDTTEQTTTTEHLKGFTLIELVYENKLEKINHYLHHLPLEELTAAYWLINKQLHIMLSIDYLEGAHLNKITPWRSMHRAIERWYLYHKPKLPEYAKLSYAIEKSLKGDIGLPHHAKIKELFTRMGQSR